MSAQSKSKSRTQLVASPLLLPLLVLLLTLLFVNNVPRSNATPLREVEVLERDTELEKRTQFPDYPPSCQICEMHYDEIDSCANASVAFANIAAIMFSPLTFIEVIECACADTFQSAYAQCVDCFEQTNQTAFLEPQGGNYSSIIIGMRQICALGSSIFGHVGSVNSELPGQTPITVASQGAAPRRYGLSAGLSGDGWMGLGLAVGTILFGGVMGVWTVL